VHCAQPVSCVAVSASVVMCIVHSLSAVLLCLPVWECALCTDCQLCCCVCQCGNVHSAQPVSCVAVCQCGNVHCAQPVSCAAVSTSVVMCTVHILSAVLLCCFVCQCGNVHCGQPVSCAGVSASVVMCTVHSLSAVLVCLPVW